MKILSESFSGKKPEGAKKVKTYSFAPEGPVMEKTTGDLPLHKGVYFGFKYDKEKAKEGTTVFTELIYVGRAIKSNTLRKRVSDHYTQKDLKYRKSGKTVDMSNVVFYYLDLDNLTNDQISDVEYAFIFQYQPSANTDGIEHYAGDETPINIKVTGFKFADDLNISRSFLITEQDKEIGDDE